MLVNLSEKYNPEVVIVANGALSDDERTNQLIEQAPHLIICDGALSEYRKLTERTPDVVIGDGDSVELSDLEEMGVEFIKVTDQETNDLTKAVRYALSRGWKEMGIIGASGKREDHALGNIALLSEYHQMGAMPRMISKYGVMMPFEGLIQLKVKVGQQLSLFALSSTPMSARGVAYPFEDRSFRALWEATLNYAQQEIIEVESAEVALIYIAWEVRR